MSKEVETTENTFDTFSWDSNVPEIDFFGESTPNPSLKAEDVAKEIENEEEDGKVKPTSTKEKEEEPEIDFFGEKPKEEKTEETSNEEAQEEEEEEKIVTTNVAVVSLLKDKGIIDFELEEGEELDEEEAELLLTEKFEESIDKKLEQTIADLPESVKNIVRFATKGGDVDKMLAEMSKPRVGGITRDLDLEEENNQELVVRFQLSKEGYDEEYIDTHIEVLKDTNKLKTIAEKHHSKWKKDDESKEKAMVEAQKEAKLKAKQTQINFKKEITEHLAETESVNNLKFSKADAKELPDYISNTSIKLQDGREITPFYRDLFEAMKDKDKLLVLAKLVKNNFDFKDIEKQAATKQVDKLKDDLQRQKQGKTMKSAGGSSQPKRLADYFD